MPLPKSKVFRPKDNLRIYRVLLEFIDNECGGALYKRHVLHSLAYETLGFDDRDEYSEDEEDYDEEYQLEEAGERRQKAGTLFQLYDEEHWKEILECYFVKHWKFQTVQQRYKKLKDRKQIHR